MEKKIQFSGKTALEVIPVRTDFTFVYNTLKHEITLGHEVFSIRALRHLMQNKGVSLGYAKLLFILTIFAELQILQVDELDSERDIFQFRLIFGRPKVNLDNSTILQRLRLCADID